MYEARVRRRHRGLRVRARAIDGDGCTESDACVYGSCRGAALDYFGLDGPCLVGQCEGETGACSVVIRANGWPCEDGDPCSDVDECNSGESSAGPVNACEPCALEEPAALCFRPDDACSSEFGQCVSVAGQLVCQDPGRDFACSEPHGCALNRCDATDGGCSVVVGADWTACDDGNSCTFDDHCASGICEATPLELCGAQPSACTVHLDNMGFVANDGQLDAFQWEESAPGVLTGQLLGGVENTNEEEVFGVTLIPGTVFTLTTGAPCGSSVDTTVALYPVKGTNEPTDGAELTDADWVTELVATNDNASDSAWSTLVYEVPLTAGEFGDNLGLGDVALYIIRVGAWQSPGPGSFLLDLTAEIPVPCADDSDCACDSQQCFPDGRCRESGQVEPEGLTNPTTGEPFPTGINDDPSTPTTITSGSTWQGHFGNHFDVDYWYAVAVVPDLPYRVRTEQACNSIVDPHLAVFDGDGTTLAEAVDGPAGDHVTLSNLVTSSAILKIRVTDTAIHPGDYLLTVEIDDCILDADCACPDKACLSVGEEEGVNICQLTSPVTEATLAASAPALLAG